VKKLLAILLLFTISTQWIVKLGVITDWKINQEYIAKTSCVNRNKPQLECNGKCQLQKRLKELDSQTNSKETLPIQKLKLLEFENFVSNTSFKLEEPYSMVFDFNTEFISLYKFYFIEFCFHPPTALVS